MTPRVIILAGQRPGPDALCDKFGVGSKADIPIAGIAMLDRVQTALEQADLLPPYTLSGYVGDRTGFTVAPHGVGPADSALLAAQSGTLPALVTSCDHALLTEEILRDFLDGAVKSEADFAVGLVTSKTVMNKYPEQKCTYWKFQDVSVSGTDLFYIANEKGLRVIEFWRQMQHLRRQPLKIVRRVGVGMTIRYVLGQLSLRQALAYAGKNVGASIAPVILEQAEAAIDADNLADFAVIEKILTENPSYS
jgi:hypothetical protein